MNFIMSRILPVRARAPVDQHQLLFGSLAVISVSVCLACFSSDETNVSHWVNRE